MRKIPSLIATLCISLLAATTVLAQQVWIDVRSVEEHDKDSISGDASIPLATLDAAALAARYGKDAEIMLYCRSGNRAGQAKTLLDAAGFTHVTNAGGISEVRELRDLAAAQSSPTQ